MYCLDWIVGGGLVEVDNLDVNGSPEGHGKPQ
jgi:hypothetical protein